jgi:hypothetical protein
VSLSDCLAQPQYIRLLDLVQRQLSSRLQRPVFAPPEANLRLLFFDPLRGDVCLIDQLGRAFVLTDPLGGCSATPICSGIVLDGMRAAVVHRDNLIAMYERSAAIHPAGSASLSISLPLPAGFSWDEPGSSGFRSRLVARLTTEWPTVVAPPGVWSSEGAWVLVERNVWQGILRSLAQCSAEEWAPLTRAWLAWSGCAAPMRSLLEAVRILTQSQLDVKRRSASVDGVLRVIADKLRVSSKDDLQFASSVESLMVDFQSMGLVLAALVTADPLRHGVVDSLQGWLQALSTRRNVSLRTALAEQFEPILRAWLDAEEQAGTPGDGGILGGLRVSARFDGAWELLSGECGKDFVAWANVMSLERSEGAALLDECIRRLWLRLESVEDLDPANVMQPEKWSGLTAADWIGGHAGVDYVRPFRESTPLFETMCRCVMVCVCDGVRV